jgi:hypothetical protein
LACIRIAISLGDRKPEPEFLYAVSVRKALDHVHAWRQILPHKFLANPWSGRNFPRLPESVVQIRKNVETLRTQNGLDLLLRLPDSQHSGSRGMSLQSDSPSLAAFSFCNLRFFVCFERRIEPLPR